MIDQTLAMRAFTNRGLIDSKFNCSIKFNLTKGETKNYFSYFQKQHRVFFCN